MAITINVGERRTLTANPTNSGLAVDADIAWTCNTAGVLVAWPLNQQGLANDPNKMTFTGRQLVVEGKAAGGPVTITATITAFGSATTVTATFQITVSATADALTITSN